MKENMTLSVLQQKQKAIFFACLLAGIVAHSSLAQEQQTLQSAFKNHFLIGAALNESQFSEQDKLSSSLVKKHFNSITAENNLKWEHVHPKPSVYNFGPADAYVDFGIKYNMFTIGHTLVWHAQTPAWVFKDEKGIDATKEQLLERLKEHIQTVVGRYKGKIKGWDVVNEALDEDGSLRKSPWLKIIGEEYIAKAFQFAREADPNVELYYNDYSIENIPKRKGTIALIKKLQLQGIRVDGIGIQGHYIMDWPTAGLLDSTIKEFSDLGVKVLITELDIDVLPRPDGYVGAEISRTSQYQAKYNPYANGLPEVKQKEITARYVELFKVFAKYSGKISRVTFWGVSDANTWLNDWPIFGRKNFPLLFDREGKPKPAFDAVLKTSIK